MNKNRDVQLISDRIALFLMEQEEEGLQDYPLDERRIITMLALRRATETIWSNSDESSLNKNLCGYYDWWPMI